jgi:hypothetical protein
MRHVLSKLLLCVLLLGNSLWTQAMPHCATLAGATAEMTIEHCPPQSADFAANNCCGCEGCVTPALFLGAMTLNLPYKIAEFHTAGKPADLPLSINLRPERPPK